MLDAASLQEPRATLTPIAWKLRGPVTAFLPVGRLELDGCVTFDHAVQRLRPELLLRTV